MSNSSSAFCSLSVSTLCDNFYITELFMKHKYEFTLNNIENTEVL